MPSPLERILKFSANPDLYIRKKVQKELLKRVEIMDFCTIDEVQDRDIFIAGFPKSGNTWMQNLIATIILHMDAKELPDSLTQDLIPDLHARHIYKRYFPAMFFKTHDLPKPIFKRVIYLVRDGRDAMVSYRAMNQNLGIETSLHDMIKKGKDVFPCSWFEHTEQWMANPYKAEIITVKYEDLLTNPLPELKKICAFIKVERSDEFLQNTISGNSIAAMREKQKKFGLYNKRMNKDGSFIRKGKSGAFKNEMTEELQSYFRIKGGKALEYFNYTNK